MNSIKAVAFDIDGTLYANWRLYIRIVPHFLKNLNFFLSYKKVRDILHRTAPLPDFYEYQARLLADAMHVSVDTARTLINDKVYCGLCKYFPKITPYKNAVESFEIFKKAGLKCAILSDFPPQQKGDIWGAEKFCDVVLGSEGCGALKPSVYTFGTLAEKLGLKSEEILYVGNNIKADIIGARNAGMKTAYLMPFWRRLFGLKLRHADISFKNYRQLQEIVLH